MARDVGVAAAIISHLSPGVDFSKTLGLDDLPGVNTDLPSVGLAKPLPPLPTLPHPIQ